MFRREDHADGLEADFHEMMDAHADRVNDRASIVQARLSELEAESFILHQLRLKHQAVRTTSGPDA